VGRLQQPQLLVLLQLRLCIRCRCAGLLLQIATHINGAQIYNYAPPKLCNNAGPQVLFLHQRCCFVMSPLLQRRYRMLHDAAGMLQPCRAQLHGRLCMPTGVAQPLAGAAVASECLSWGIPQQPERRVCSGHYKQ
jgi:hypothetical protein